ncbi:MAG: ABC transporter permease [Syntrophobacteraceae bacterium]
MPESPERQVVQPWAQVIRISFNSMRVRLFRSLITTLTLTLAIAFTAYIRSGYEILNSVWARSDDSLRDYILSIGYELSDGRFGNSPKDQWLAILSLLVCVVGIVNAQLMAVSERFREIGTFKCLGALDSFVVRIFVLEAAYQGLIGGLAGGVLGIFAATLSLLFKLGWVAILDWPAFSMLVTVGAGSLLAVFLSLLGVSYPALLASRMHPAAALKTEQ